MLIWEGIYEGRIGIIHITKPVSPLMGSEAPCCGDGLCGNCLLIIHFIFLFSKTPKIQYFLIFPKFSTYCPLNFTR